MSKRPLLFRSPAMFSLTVPALAGLAACSDQVVGPEQRPGPGRPSFATIIPSGSNTAFDETIAGNLILCKVGSANQDFAVTLVKTATQDGFGGSPHPDGTLLPGDVPGVGVLVGTNGSGQTTLTTTINPTRDYGQTIQGNSPDPSKSPPPPSPLRLPVGCRLVLKRNAPLQNGSSFSPLEYFRATETAAPGFTTTARAYLPSAAGIPNGQTTVTSPNNTIELNFNYYHGAVVEFTNTASKMGCTFTQGYYKNKGDKSGVVKRLLERSHPYIRSGELFVGGSTLGGATLDAKEIDKILSTSPKGGDAELILLHQLITAELNVVGGASATTQISADIERAQWLLVGGISAGKRSEAISIAGRLDAFNNGKAPGGPQHCDKDDDDKGGDRDDD